MTLPDNAHRRDVLDRLETRFETLYPNRGKDCVKRLKLLLDCYEDRLADGHEPARWNEADIVLITYGDMVKADDAPPLMCLNEFLTRRARDVIGTVHLLPFFPWSSDDGFSVIDYRQVNPELGTWTDVERIGESFDLMFDLVLNHCSKRSSWFRDFVIGVAPGRDYFIEMAPGTDLSQVVRPRTTPLLTPIQTRAGERWVWTTFSDDQIDLNFANPNVLLEFIDILLQYLVHGARILRLDAIAYLWKQIGTGCIHLEQTHEVVRVLRDVVEIAAPDALILTETNVPHEQNISYFGHGDEAHAVYNFSLPPLLLDALLNGSARYLTRWLGSLTPPPADCTYLNFTASHDGIGVRPAEDLLPKTRFDKLCQTARALGGEVSQKTNPDGSSSPYELNITWFDAMGRPDEADDQRKLERMLTSQAIMLALRGIPAVYFNNLVGGSNDYQGVKETGRARAINRHKWDRDELNAALDDPSNIQARVFDELCRMIRIRRAQPAFHPDAAQRAVKVADTVLAIERTARDDSQTILAASNVSDQPVDVELRPRDTRCAKGVCVDLLAEDDHPLQTGRLQLEPYQTRWLAMAGREA